jgi:hypothetical protein
MRVLALVENLRLCDRRAVEITVWTGESTTETSRRQETTETA